MCRVFGTTAQLELAAPPANGATGQTAGTTAGWRAGVSWGG